ncbi:TPA: protein kinase domain-containing protein [Stenotrophomonas maltophilia]|nr:protein kinase [Stenotrophomonas maltophilia]HEL3255939.1 protein kinase [Stenotrophomonas maltophilia]
MLDRSVQDRLESLSETYDIEGREVKGANGWVFYATNKVTGVKVAIKFYFWGDVPDLHSEPRSLAQFNSPNIVPILSAEIIRDGWACFITPRFPEDLEGAIARGSLSTHAALDVGINVLSGLGALHATSIVHRDVKPANILLGIDGIAAIGDFGSVATIRSGSEDVPSSQHSVLYRPPESFETGRFGPVGDIYQVGITLYEAFGAELPKDPQAWMSKREVIAYGHLDSVFDRSQFEDDVISRAVLGGRLIKLDRYPFYVSKPMRSLIAAMTSKYPEKRVGSAADAMALLVEARRKSIAWVAAGTGALGTFEGGTVRVAGDGRVDVNRGRGMRRDRTLEGVGASDSVAKVNKKFA